MWRVFTIFILTLYAHAFAAKISISAPGPNSSLEIRNAVLPSGEEVQYYVVRGLPVTITIDDDQTVVAEHLEIDLTNDLIRIIGFGSITTAEESFSGENLVVNLDDESFTGKDVLIVTEAIDVLGVDAERVPGQIDVLSGTFSPCSRCEQQVQDFGFRARRLELYPGDRLVAFNVTVVIREFPVLFLPLLVVPLAPPDRQPQLTLTQGTETERANVFVDWPYVSGPNALGTFSLRYYADIMPGEGNFFSNNLLGGSVQASYLGGGINHRFYTDIGAGVFDFFYVPSFIDYVGSGADRLPTDKTRDEFTLRFRYDTAPELSDQDLVTTNVLFERDDARLQRIAEYGVSLSRTFGRVRATVNTQGFIDLDPDDDVDTPSYDGAEPLRTPAALDFRAEDEPFSIGPFRFSNLRLNMGVFEDQSNPTNRSAASRFRVSAGRVLEQHSITLEPLNPWTGLSISGSTDFLGQYYSTQERFVDWYTRLEISQTFGNSGSFNLNFERDIQEGETPFLFDSPANPRNIIRMDPSLTFNPAPWLSFSTRGGYVFVYDVRPDAEGFDPIITNLSLFNNSSWFSLSFENTYDIREEDPGTLITRLDLRSPTPEVDASLNVTYIDDLYPLDPERPGERINESELSFSARYGIRPFVEVNFDGGTRFEPPIPENDDPPARLKPFNLGVTFGTTDTLDTVPSLGFRLERDLNEQETDQFDISFGATIAPFEVALTTNFNFETARNDIEATSPTAPWSSTLSVTWRDVATFEAKNYPFIPPKFVGLEVNENARVNQSVDLYDNFETEDIDWRLSYRSTLNPELKDGRGGFENTALEFRVQALNLASGPSQFGVEFLAKWRLLDDQLDRTFLDEMNFTLLGSFYDTFGVQGSLGYNGNYSSGAEELSQSRLTIDDLAFTVKLYSEIYISAIFNDIWDFTNTNDEETPYNFQPEIRVTWDRCCWALYGSWDTEDGAISITLTTPGAAQGFTQDLDSPFIIPRRAPVETEETNP